MESSSRNSGLAIIALLLSMVSLTLGASIAKGLFPFAGAAGITFLRLGIATILISIFRRPWRTRLSVAQGRWVVLYGAILGGMNLTFYYAIERLPIGLAIAIEFLGPLSVAIFLSRRPRDLLWAALALAGVLLLVPRGSAGGPVDPVGVGFALVAAFAWAMYILVGKRLSGWVPPAPATAYGMFTGCLVAAPFGLLPALGLAQNPRLLPAAVAVGIFSSAVPYTLELFSLKALDPKTFGILLSLEPACGALTGFIVLGERLSFAQIFAIALVCAASVGSSVGDGRKKMLPAEVAVP